MSSLEILRAKFGDTPVLNVDQIAECLNVSRGHIYNLVSKERLPFKLLGFSDKIQVSMAALAKYLDGDAEPTPKPEVGRPDMVIKRKPGRPRASSNVSKLQIAFQGQLKLSIFHVETKLAFAELEETVRGLTYRDDEVSCAAKFEALKIASLSSVGEARIAITKSLLNLLVPPTAAVKKKSFGI